MNLKKLIDELTEINESLKLELLENKQLEQILQMALKRTQDTLDSLFVFVGVFSVDGILLEANRALLEAADLNKSDIIGKYFWNIQWWSHSVEVQKQLKQSLMRAATGETIRFDTSFFVSDQKIIDLDITFGPLYDSKGKITQLIGSAVDITDRYEAINVAQKYRDELAHASRLTTLGELVAGISHELNQPLTAIANYSSAIKVLLQQGQDVSDLMNKIEMQSIRSGEIVRKLILLSKKQKQQPIFFNITASTRSILDLLSYEIRSGLIQVKIVTEEVLPTVYADRTHIEQVLLNLIKNAIEAMRNVPQPGCLTISISSISQKRVLISVADTGKGIPEELIDLLFASFTTNKKEGLGIGLALSKSLIEASNGKLWFCSNPNGGATFNIELPAIPT